MKPITGKNIRENYYSITEKGVVLVTSTGHPTQQWKDRKGYLRVSLMTGKRNETSGQQIHALLAAAYLTSDYVGRLVVDHIDGNITNNDLGNLRLVTQRENQLNRFKVVAKSGITGVHALMVCGIQKWKAVGKLNGKIQNLGDHLSPIEAAKARYLWEQKNGATTMLNTRPDLVAQFQGGA